MTYRVFNKHLIHIAISYIYNFSFICCRFVTKPTGNIGLYDPAEIHNRHQLKAYMRDNMIKMGVHLIFFFIFLYW